MDQLGAKGALDACPDELRLAALAAASVFIFVAGWRFSEKQTGSDRITRLADAMLFFYLVQYLAIGVLGMLGLLYPLPILILACLIGAALRAVPGPGSDGPLDRRDGAAFAAALVVVVSYLVVLAWQQRLLPPVGDDPLTYHLPAAVQWFQQGRLSLYETWNYNPANTYSPLAGSMFILWLMAPLGNDVLARYVQMPALVLVFAASVALCRGLGARPPIAAFVGLAVALSGPMLRQAIIGKDDLFVAGFFTMALAAMSGPRLRDRLGPYRLGAAIGLMLATKYTALMSLPLLLLAIDAPHRAGWSCGRWMIALAVIALLAGPWFMRNYLITGNPIYPIDNPLFAGMFRTARSARLASLQGIHQALVGTHFAPPPLLWIGMLGVWVHALIRVGGSIRSSPLIRVVIIGPIVGMGIFLIASPYEEIRFINPSLVLLLIASAFDRVAAVAMVGMSLGTNFVPSALATLVPPAWSLSVLILAVATLWQMLRHRRTRLAIASLGFAAVAAAVFVYWQAYLIAYRQVPVWRSPTFGYMPLAEAWYFVREQIPSDQTLAYANTFYIYPLYGFDLRRRIVYAPPDPRIAGLHTLPRIDPPLAGEQIVPHIMKNTNASASLEAWLARLRDQQADYLLIAKTNITGSPALPPELEWARSDPQRFQCIFENPAAAVYRVLP